MTTERASRRAVLAAGATALAATAGCVDAFAGSDGNDDVVLDPPENHDRRTDLDIPYPTYGDRIPETSVPAPLHDREVSTREFVGDRHVMMTFIYTSCRTVCPGLTASLRQVQADAVERDYSDEMAFLPTTFDPEQDTPEQLRAYGEDLGVNHDAGNWYFLRPETPESAKSVVEETFGVAFESGEGATARWKQPCSSTLRWCCSSTRTDSSSEPTTAARPGPARPERTPGQSSRGGDDETARGYRRTWKSGRPRRRRGAYTRWHRVERVEHGATGRRNNRRFGQQ
ncbi:SCO family protein [Halovenus salina]|uniref:SCO family protein n=1 Tax=Halovenus salina TaxID=1510225 RepID=A0ABD5VYX0_9EURY